MNTERRIKMYKIHHDDKYGVVLTIQDSNVADELDDFLTENHYVFYDLRPHTASTEFYFGQASSIDKVEEMVAAYQVRN